MSTLWIKVSDEVEISGRLSENEQTKLAAAFDHRDLNSPWRKALALLGMRVPLENPLIIRFVEGTPFFNGTALALASSHGTIYPTNENGKLEYKTRLGIFGLFRIMWAQWKLEKFLAQDAHGNDPLKESIALGLAIQSLMLRLPSKSETELATWLAAPADCPPASRGTVKKILALQSRRNSLSKHWSNLFEPGKKGEPNPSLPANFWNEPPALPTIQENRQISTSTSAQSWKGIPVCPGIVEGDLVWIESNNVLSLPEGSGLMVLGFARAKPETTEHFLRASALIFAEGGALSHACSIAREQGVPCVSGVGRSFVSAVTAWKIAGIPIRVSLNGSTGEVSCTPGPI